MMESSKPIYASFLFEWTVKSTSYQIRYRKIYDINEIDEIFCTIINAKGNQIRISELGSFLGFNLYDLAESDILNIYLKQLTEYGLIEIHQKVINLTESGQEALQSKLKYKYFYATSALFENQTATGESLDFSFKKVFDLENELSQVRNNDNPAFEDIHLQQKLQFQLFENDINHSEIIDLINSKPYITYKTIVLQCNVFESDNSFEISFYKSGIYKDEVENLISLPENEELKSNLIRKGMYHRILASESLITTHEIKKYIDLWDWRELAENPRVNWNDKAIFELFRENGDGNIWSSISDKAPLENIKPVIQEYVEHWNWTTLTQRVDNNFIKEQIEKFNWDFEELSYKETGLVTALLSNAAFKESDWDWNYLSKNLPDEFIESHIEDFKWDFYEITVSKNEIFKNTFIKYRDKLETLISKNWNWKFISEEINLNFLYKNISVLASKIDWHIVLNRFFNNEEITVKLLKDETFKSLLKNHLPDNFVIAHQKYIWSSNLIEFFEQQNLVQWESKAYINGFDTNENVEWDKDVFQKYYNRIVTEKGHRNISQHISDYALIQEFPDFAWVWEGISTNINLTSNTNFIENAFSGKLSFSNDLLWNEILLHSRFDVDFWNKHLKAFYNATDGEKHIQFWTELTQKEEKEYIFANPHFPWDWNFITKNSSAEIILDNFDDEELLKKWNWEIATRKLDKETILKNLEDLTDFIDWKYLIRDLFEIEDELSINNQLPRIVACLSVLKTEKRNSIWKELTKIYPFETLFNYVIATSQLEVFEWDWEYISNHNYFPTDIHTLNQFKEKINWTIFSESSAIQIKFNRNNGERGWFGNTNNYLRIFNDFWDWEILSKNRSINYDRRIISNYKSEKWDWEYLSQSGGFLKKRDGDEVNYLATLLNQFRLYIKFDDISKRSDVIIESDLILNFRDNRWNWEILSENKCATLTIELLLELSGKTWNWGALSKRNDLVINNEALIELYNKNWDWAYLSECVNLEFNTEFIEATKLKPWNWKVVSIHKSFLPTIEILTLTHEFDLDWQYLSQHSNLLPTKELLAKFENKWDWHNITQNPQINFADINLIERFADKWDWGFICKSGRLPLNTQVLSQFKKYLKWNLISANTNIDFTKKIIQQFKSYWNWTILKANKRAQELLGNYMVEEISKSAILTFIDKIEQQHSRWKGHIYHFSHIDNAVQIIREKKIKSRQTANQLSDSAGNVVYSRTDAHPYARFYFRPHTQTQFYNEFQGIDNDMGYKDKFGAWHSWYDVEYRLLDYPKCPTPIYFEFSLQEVLFAMFEKCNISTGNMQRTKTKFGKIEALLHLFNFQDLFINPGMDSEEWRKFREYAQQEFMIEKELDFSSLTHFKIVCANENDRSLLIKLLGEDSVEVINNIVVRRSYYRNENPAIDIEILDNSLIISSSKQAEGYFILVGDNVSILEIVGGDIIKQEKNKITFKSSIEILNQSTIDITVKYIDEINQEWFIYSNYELKKKDYENIRVVTRNRKSLRVNSIYEKVF